MKKSLILENSCKSQLHFLLKEVRNFLQSNYKNHENTSYVNALFIRLRLTIIFILLFFVATATKFPFLAFYK